MRKKRVLTLFTLTMINIAAIGSVKNWALTAEYGVSALSYLILAACAFFLPLALVTAELATTWPQPGGIYLWIKQAFGHRIGFLAIWLFWLLNVLWYPTILSFIAAGVAYVISPELTHYASFTLPVTLLCFWLVTLLNLGGIKLSSWVSTLGALCGTLLPGVFIIGLGVTWWISDKPSAIVFNAQALIPSFSSIEQVVFFVGILLSFCGIEMSAMHAKDVKQPQKNYPRAILITGVVIIGMSALGVLAIASVVPSSEISLVAGSLQAFARFLDAYHLTFLFPVVAISMILGALGSLSSWVIATTRGLLAAAQEGDLPYYFHAVNKKNMPYRLLIIQALIVSVLCLPFAFCHSLSVPFWVLSALLTQLYLIIYVLLFAAALRLRYLQPSIKRPYQIPFGNRGIWIVVLLGIFSSVFAIFIGFFPPAQLATLSPLSYALLLMGSVLVCCSAPLVLRKKIHNTP